VRFRRTGVLLLVVVASAMAGCSAQTEGSNNVTPTSADLHATGRCDQGQRCSWYWEYWPATGPRSASTKTAVSGPAKGPSGDVGLTEHLTGLQPGTTYRWVFCGSPNAGSSYGCVGPNGTSGSATADPPPDSATFKTAEGYANQPAPNPAGAKTTGLTGVSCTYQAACVAVGTSTTATGTPATLIERYDGHALAIQPSPNPSGAKSSSLAGVSCTTYDTSCIAVGSSTTSTGTPATLAETRNGTTWTIQPTPNPSGAKSSSLAGVSCLSDTECVAVGSSTNGTGAQTTLAERFDGTAWTIVPTPNPSGAKSSSLAGVTCDPATTCTAVGRSIDGAGRQTTLVESLDGAAWKILASENPSGATSSDLKAVWCNGECWAVGSSTDSTGATHTLAESPRGAGWAVIPSLSPEGASGSGLSGVWCLQIRASGCEAVGDWTGNGVTHTLAEGSLGGLELQASTDPAGETSSRLAAVSCAGAEDLCLAVGDYGNGSGTRRALAEVFPGPR
jgi:hypothetical protein